MKLLLIFLSFFCLAHVYPFSVSQKDITSIAEKIWKNECGGTIDGLIVWNKGENFPSLGIGHFIWYPEGKKDRFEETFPKLVRFLQEKKIPLPDWLKKVSGCPWKTREEFYEKINTSELKSLRQLLLDTKDHQAVFIAKRLENTFPQMIENLPKTEKEKLTKVFEKLATDPHGLYALIDYLNFKGSGISPLERYQGEGWGLLQVLERLSPASENIVADFSEAAKFVLTQRVQNSPIERHEERWLKGWLNRVKTYDLSLR